ncbi:hypothetical protein ACTVM4_20125 [Serratia ureilytica]|uniref:hypothetical protein n=1 Tax=Serratia ureilytica TaxID=300181 RepID=UPI0018D72004|nr:hypothetical protein [Serratia ureilytica]MBH2718431.1 hypothetical protein [Serratia ureilytica]MBS7519390.1 hypothetical protein [Serratia ureilytica]
MGIHGSSPQKNTKGRCRAERVREDKNSAAPRFETPRMLQGENAVLSAVLPEPSISLSRESGQLADVLVMAEYGGFILINCRALRGIHRMNKELPPNNILPDLNGDRAAKIIGCADQ